MTASAPKKRAAKLGPLREFFNWQASVFLVIAVFVALVGGVYFNTINTNEFHCTIRTKLGFLDTMNKDRLARRLCVELTTVDTPAGRALGLSGQDLTSTGMLFVYDSPGTQCMWMKDMRYSLDMIWLDKNKTITFIERNVSPDTYPQKFCGHGQDQYVIEIPAGLADLPTLSIGQQLNF